MVVNCENKEFHKSWCREELTLEGACQGSTEAIHVGVPYRDHTCHSSLRLKTLPCEGHTEGTGSHSGESEPAGGGAGRGAVRGAAGNSLARTSCSLRPLA